jgi:hypothetical protein
VPSDSESEPAVAASSDSTGPARPAGSATETVTGLAAADEALPGYELTASR